MTKKATVKTIAAGYASNTQLNFNVDALNDKFDNTLSLDGSSPNAMGADLDLNNNDILNAGSVSTTELIHKGVILTDPSILTGVTEQEYPTVALLLASTEASRGTGAIWEAGGFRYIEVASGGDITTDGGVELDVILKAPEIGVNALAFGAVGDGVADDTTKVQTALDSGAKVIFLPSGTYLVSALTITNVSLEGEGSTASIIKGSVAANNVVTIATGTDFRTYRSFGVTHTSGSATGDCVVLGDNTHNLTFSDLHLTFGARGIYSAAGDTHWMCNYTNVRCTDQTSEGFHINSNSSSSTTLSFRNCYTTGVPTGFYLNNVQDLTMQSCAVDGGSVFGFDLQYIKGGVVQSSHFETCDFGATSNKALIYMWSCNGVTIDGITSSSNTADIDYYIVRHDNGNTNIFMRNLQSQNPTNESFMYVGPLSTPTNTNFIISGIDAALTTAYDGSGDFSAKNLDYAVVHQDGVTNASGVVDFGSFPAKPDYLNRRIISWIDDGFVADYCAQDLFVSSYQARLLKLTDGTADATSGITIRSMVMHERT